MRSIGSPTEKPPSARPSKGRAPSSSAWARRRSAKQAPWTIPKSAWRSGRGAASARLAQRVVRATAASTTGRGESPGGHTSSCIWMSAPRRPCTRTASSGVSVCFDPSRCDLNAKPSSASVDERAHARSAVDEREGLEAARVGEHRVRPPREGVEAAEPGDRARPRAAASGGTCCRARRARPSTRPRPARASSRCPACRRA